MITTYYPARQNSMLLEILSHRYFSCARKVCISICLILLCALFNNTALFAQKQGQALLDSLLAELPKAKEDTNKVNLLSKISDEYSDIKPSQGVIYGEKGIALSESLHFKSGMAACLYASGINHRAQTNYPKALELFLKALNINEAIGDKSGIARNIGAIGLMYDFQTNYQKALEYYLKALNIYENLGNKSGMAKNMLNIGTIYAIQSNYPKALEYQLKAKSIYETLGDKSGMAMILTNIGTIFSDKKNYSKALENYLKSLSLYEALGDKSGIAISVENVGEIYFFNRNYPKTLDHYLKALRIYEELGDKIGVARNIGNIGIVYENQNNYANALDYDLKSLSLNKTLGDKYGIATNIKHIGSVYRRMAKDSVIQNERRKEYLTRSISNLESAAKIFKEISALNDYQDVQYFLSEAYELNKQYGKALIAFKEHTTYKDSIFSEEKNNELTRKEFDFTYAKREDSIKLETEKKDAINKVALSNQKTMTNASLAGTVLLLLVALVSIKAYRQKHKANAIITQEKQKSEALLLNILPEEIAEELKLKGSATAKHFDEVTVLFTDFVNFTKHSERLSPTELVASLNECFTAFDAIIERNGLEKIKTIGDAYMAVCGLPVSDADHATKSVKAALEIRDYVAIRNQTHGAEGFEIRIGLHSGSVVAGIIGVKKFAYDIWGDTVNFAARMESSGATGKVNISENTYQLVKNQFTFEHRGKISAKNKGEVDMYFVENKLV